MSLLPADYSIEEFVASELTEHDQLGLLDLFNLSTREREPRHQDYSLDDLLVVLESPGEVRTRHLIRDGSGDIVAHSNAAYADDGSNPDRMRAMIMVHPDHRRLGLGTALLCAVVDACEAAGRTRLNSFIFDTVPAGEAFLEALGGEKTVDHHGNVLPIAELDRDLMTQWVEDGPKRAPGYRVAVIEGAYPDELLDSMAHLYVILERDMPTEEGQEPRNWDAAVVSQMISHFAESAEILTAVAFHEESNEAVGMSQLFRRKGDPTTWVVTTTMVDPEHRGRALGKWVKGAVNQAALENWPGGEYQETGNAKTNRAMLGINHAMGFRPELTIWEVAASIESVKAYLASRP